MQVVKESKLKCFLLLLSTALLAVGVVAANSGNSATEQEPALIQQPDASSRAFTLLTGIPQHGAVLGYPKAPVTLEFFGDLQCTSSRRVMLGALPFLIRHWVRAGKLRIRFRSTETDTRSAGGWYEFREQQSAAMAAGKQGKLWNFINVFYREQGPEFSGYADDAFLNRIAAEAGLNIPSWSQDRKPLRDEAIDLINSDEELAATNHLHVTPSFLIGRTGGAMRKLRHFSFEESKVFDEAVRDLLPA